MKKLVVSFIFILVSLVALSQERGDKVEISCTNGEVFVGTVIAKTTDNIKIEVAPGQSRIIYLSSISSISTAPFNDTFAIEQTKQQGKVNSNGEIYDGLSRSMINQKQKEWQTEKREQLKQQNIIKLQNEIDKWHSKYPDIYKLYGFIFDCSFSSNLFLTHVWYKPLQLFFSLSAGYKLNPHSTIGIMVSSIHMGSFSLFYRYDVYGGKRPFFLYGSFGREFYVNWAESIGCGWSWPAFTVAQFNLGPTINFGHGYGDFTCSLGVRMGLTF